MVEKLDMVTLFVFSFYGTFVLFIVVFLLIVSFCCYWHKQNRKKNAFVNQHVVVTGGSSGIGKSVAVEAAKRGANVTIIARDPNKLQTAKDEITRACQMPTQRVKTISLDISDNYEEIEKSLSNSEEESGPIFMLVNCAGSAICGKVEDTSVDDFKYMMKLNFLGSVLPTKYVIPGMKTRGCGHIVFTASQAALVGIFGYTAYSSSKYALRGLAEALHMEVNPYGVKVTVALPPDTDTPGFILEEKCKPMETRLISETSGLVSPDTVAVQLLDDAINGRFYSGVGFESFLLTTLCGGMSPVTSVFDLLCQNKIINETVEVIKTGNSLLSADIYKELTTDKTEMCPRIYVFQNYCESGLCSGRTEQCIAGSKGGLFFGPQNPNGSWGSLTHQGS